MSNILLPKPALGTPIAKGELLSKGLVANFPFSDGRGDILSDFSLEKNHGTITGATWAGNGIDFDGSNSWVDLGSDIDVFDLVNTTRNTITVAAWIFLRSGVVRFIISNGDNSSGAFKHNQWFIAGLNTTIVFGVGDGTTQNYLTTPTDSINYNKWYYVVGTINSDKLMRVYINGVLQLEATYSLTPYSAQKETSISKNAASQSFDGIISEVAVYDRALSASEIIQLYLNPALPMQQPPIWLFTPPVVGVNPKGPLGHPLFGPFAGPIAC